MLRVGPGRLVEKRLNVWKANAGLSPEDLLPQLASMNKAIETLRAQVRELSDLVYQMWDTDKGNRPE